MADQAKLKAAIAKYGLKGTPGEVLAALYAVSVAAVRPIAGTELGAWAAGGADESTPCRKLRIDAAAAGTVPTPDNTLAAYGVARNQVIGAAIAAQLFFGSPGETRLDLRLADRRQLLDVLVVGGVLTDAERTQLYQMSRGTILEAEGLGGVSLAEVRWALQP